jgi:hypothetical protein
LSIIDDAFIATGALAGAAADAAEATTAFAATGVFTALGAEVAARALVDIADAIAIVNNLFKAELTKVVCWPVAALSFATAADDWKKRMRDIVISQLESLLNTGDVSKSIGMLRTWLSIAEPGEPETLLAETSDRVRPRVALLMRDLLSRYPTTVVGAPMLIFAAPDYEDTSSPWPKALKLPFPELKDAQPCEDLHFLGWIPAETPLPVHLPFRPEHYHDEIQWLTPTSVVALFRTHPGLFDLDEVALPSQWWGKLFGHSPANIHVTARMLLPYPDAIEVSRVMQACTRAEPTPDKGHFLSDTAWSLALDEATLFQESCRHLFKDAAG